MRRPTTPPALLALATASLAALSMSIPAAAYCPLNCAKKPSLMAPLVAGREDTVAVAGAAAPARIRTATLNRATSVLLTRTVFTWHLPRDRVANNGRYVYDMTGTTAGETTLL